MGIYYDYNRQAFERAERAYLTPPEFPEGDDLECPYAEESECRAERCPYYEAESGCLYGYPDMSPVREEVERSGI